LDVKIELASSATDMELQLQQREKEGIQILDLHGHLTEGASEAKLRAAIVDLTEAKIVNVILNFAGVIEIDADGLGALSFCDARLTSLSGAMRLLNLSPRHLDLMVITKLNTISQVFTDEQNAINSFFPDRASLRYDILEFVEQPHEPSDL
jgi:anti-sigma B factor antagonist